MNRHHFAICLRNRGCYLLDLHSACGTSLRIGGGAGGNCGDLQADFELRPGSWQVIGFTPLRSGDVFGHPVCPLILERAAPMTVDEWLTGRNSQAMLLAIRDSSFAEPGRLRTFLDRCIARLDAQHRDEAVHRRLREHADTWSAAAGLARFVVATASSGPESKQEAERALDDAEFALCQLLRECFDNPLLSQSPTPASSHCREAGD